MGARTQAHAPDGGGVCWESSWYWSQGGIEKNKVIAGDETQATWARRQGKSSQKVAAGPHRPTGQHARCAALEETAGLATQPPP